VGAWQEKRLLARDKERRDVNEGGGEVKGDIKAEAWTHFLYGSPICGVVETRHAGVKRSFFLRLSGKRERMKDCSYCRAIVALRRGKKGGRSNGHRFKVFGNPAHRGEGPKCHE